jgi:hypothetical protein
MKRLAAVMAIAAIAGCAAYAATAVRPDSRGWYTLFNGKDLTGWKVGDNAGTFKVDSGLLVANGNVAHLFYDGPVCEHNFKNFEFECDVMTFPKANSGIYFHTQYQEKGWPNIGYEAQVNTTHSDPKKTGGLYGIQDVFEAPAKDNEWFHYYIAVKGKQIVIKINGKTTAEWTEPDDWPQDKGRKLSSGTFAIQGHDPESKVCFKNIRVKPMKD